MTATRSFPTVSPYCDLAYDEPELDRALGMLHDTENHDGGEALPSAPTFTILTS